MHKFKKILKTIRYFLEAIIVRAGLFFFQILGFKNASNLGSKLAKFIGKKHSTNNLARRNIKVSMPHLTDREIEKILDGMWDNLGRIAGEFIHISKFSPKELSKYVEADESTKKNLEHIKKNHNGGIIFSGHIGNWEVGPKTLISNGINVKTVYRTLNNIVVDKMTSQIRGVEMIPKSSKGNKQIIEEIKKGNYVIILADQKITDGIEVPFFGRPALTTTSFAKLAMKYNVPLIPARLIRKGNKPRFELKIDKPILVDQEKDSVLSLTTKINQKLEEWITEHPEQWFWVHNRWKK